MIDLGLEGRVVLVAGGARGIGQAVARRLGGAGAQVCVADRLQSATTIAAVEREGARAVGVVCDLTTLAGVDEALAGAGKLGPLYGIVDTVGVLDTVPIVDASDEHWDRTMEVNLRSHFLLYRAGARAIRHAGAGGRIVGIVSVIGAIFTHWNSGAYAASKAGLMLLLRTLAVELGREGITCNAIAPGWIRTDMTADYLEHQRGLMQDLTRRAALGRIGEPGDIADAVLFLCSTLSRYVTGQLLTVDGGLTVNMTLGE